MSDRKFEFRCPVHGFIELDEWEREIIEQPEVQRLRRIRQLAWTDYIYPGAMHTRFEHSLGVMHVATRLYDAVVARSGNILRDELSYDESGLKRSRRLVRLAALLHDVGHGPFSHAAEDLFPERPDMPGEHYQHDADYTPLIVRTKLRDVIEKHQLNSTNYGITADEVAALIAGTATASTSVFWRDLVSGQMDADRMDYLLRDSLHAGVEYGRYDLERLIQTVVAIPGDNGRAPRIGISEGGLHAAESLVIARYMMFTQIYFHRTRVAYDYHIQEALRAVLPDHLFPAPTVDAIDEYLGWDDWRVLGLISDERAGEHGKRLIGRNHYREVYHTTEQPSLEEDDELQKVRADIKEDLKLEKPAGKSWYKVGAADEILVLSENPGFMVKPLSQHSRVAAEIKSSNQTRLYVEPNRASEVRERIKSILKIQEGVPDE